MIIAVAGFGILAVFFMIVVEKTRDIGVLKSLGARAAASWASSWPMACRWDWSARAWAWRIGLLFVKNINAIADVLARVTGQQGLRPGDLLLLQHPHDRRSVDGRLDRDRRDGDCRVGQRLCRPVAPPCCIPWRPCAMNDIRPASSVGLRSDVRPTRPGPMAPRCGNLARRRQPAGIAAVADQRRYRPEEELSQREHRSPRAARREPQRPPRRVPGDRRPKRIGQEHAPAPAGHARRPRRRRNLTSPASGSTTSPDRAATACGTSSSA